MNIDALFDALLEVGRTGDLEAAMRLPGAGDHGSVVLAADLFSGTIVDRVAALSVEDRVALAKALAVYENTVGGIGSVTAVQHVMRLFGDDVDRGYETFRWITKNTNCLWYYKDRAIDFFEPEIANAQRAAKRAETERRNHDAAAPARAQRAERATRNLYNAVRRGDIKAVVALLGMGANPSTLAPTGESLIDYARATGRENIALQLEAARNARGLA